MFIMSINYQKCIDCIQILHLSYNIFNSINKKSHLAAFVIFVADLYEKNFIDFFAISFFIFLRSVEFSLIHYYGTKFLQHTL